MILSQSTLIEERIVPCYGKPGKIFGYPGAEANIGQVDLMNAGG